ncbi:MAG: hypothetical protein R3E79_17950 [Caldilineaceae bacterium]
MAKDTTPWVIKPLVPEEIYTDHPEFLDFFYPEALKAATRRTIVTVLPARLALFCCFDSKPTEPFPGYWGAELALKTASYYSG